jgi:hypothetical protein
MALDVRGRPALRARMQRARQEYESLPPRQRPLFDRERFRNPFGDVRIANGKGDVELRTILLGITIDVPELLLADRLRSKGQPVDVVIAHHTYGVGVAPSLVHGFMPVPVELLAAEGAPRADAGRVIGAYVEENTVVRIGCAPPHAAAAQEAGVAIVRVPHAACDNIGINLPLDAVEGLPGRPEVIPCDGFERIRRTPAPAGSGAAGPAGG